MSVFTIELESLLAQEPLIPYRAIAQRIAAAKGSDLSREERVAISKVCMARRYAHKCAEAVQERKTEDEERWGSGCVPSTNRFLVLTAYTTDTYYTDIGSFCAAINMAYCKRHGYLFREVTLPLGEMQAQIAPRDFGGYHKVLLLLALLRDERAYLTAASVTHILWIDADACVVEQDVTLEGVLARAGGGYACDLVIAEDQSPACLLNSGVFMVRVGAWAERLLQAMWDEPKYHTKRHYEQSALEKVLKQWGEGLEAIQPFHSHVSGNRSLKHFPHVCVLPRRDFNTHLVDDDDEVVQSDGEELAAFIFHPAGRRGKLQLLRKMVQLRGC